MVRTPEELEDLIMKCPYYGDAMRFGLERIGPLSGRRVLDVGCGDGLPSAFFAMRGASVTGIDKRPEALDRNHERAAMWGVADRCEFVHADAEALSFGDETFDLIFSRTVLQYVRRDVVIGHFHRILRPGGAILLIENLPWNPPINLFRVYRRLTARTDEARQYVASIRGYVRFREIRALSDRFHNLEYECYHLFRMGSRFFADQPALAARGAVMAFDRGVAFLDRALIRHLPFMDRLAWFVAIVGRKPAA